MPLFFNSHFDSVQRLKSHSIFFSSRHLPNYPITLIQLNVRFNQEFKSHKKARSNHSILFLFQTTIPQRCSRTQCLHRGLKRILKFNKRLSLGKYGNYTWKSPLRLTWLTPQVFSSFVTAPIQVRSRPKEGMGVA